MSKIFCLIGKSASGKDTLFKEIKKRIPDLGSVVMYTTRPIREGETDGVEYFFTDEEELARLAGEGKVIEQRVYETKHGKWKYFTVDDGQIAPQGQDYLIIGTLESYSAMCRYFGENRLEPLYIQVEDGLRLSRALERERKQAEPKYAEMCRRFLADTEDFSEEKIQKAGITKRFENSDFDSCVDEVCQYIQTARTGE